MSVIVIPPGETPYKSLLQIKQQCDKNPHIVEKQAILTDNNILISMENIQEGLLTKTMLSSNLIFTFWFSSYEDCFLSISESKTIFGKFQVDLLVHTLASGLTDEKHL